MYSPEELADHFNLAGLVDFVPSYNIRPSEFSIAIKNNKDQASARSMKFGFRPRWMTDKYSRKKKRYPYVNAKSETCFESPAFKAAAKQSRCLLPVNGFFEPKGKSRPRPQYYFQMPEGKLFSLASIWTEFITDDGEIVSSFAIITTASNIMMASIHDRMPAIIESSHYDTWLKSEDTEEIQSLLTPWAGDELEHWEVSSYVNKVGSNGRECINPV